jgi:predicted nucleotidyltransferase
MTRSELSIFFTTKFCDIKTEKDIGIRQRVEEHLIEAIDAGLNMDKIFFIALEGSQNYQLDLPNSDIDTKLIILPTLNDFVFNHKPISTTHIRENNEHTSITDVRNYFSSLRKQNINFIETLFSPWIIVNTMYEKEFEILYQNRELIAHYNPVKAVKTIGGVATDRYKAIYNLNSKRADVIKQYGYDGKSVSHLLRLYWFLCHYINNRSYPECILPDELFKAMILELKENKISSNIIKNYATWLYNMIQEMVNDYVNNHEEIINEEAENLLNDLQYNLVKLSLLISCADEGWHNRTPN